jgi:hypothetical protein
MSTRVFLAGMAVISLLLCIVAADTIFVVRNRQYIDASQVAQNVALEKAEATTTANLLAACQRFKAIRADANVSHYTDWTVDRRFRQFVIDLSSEVSARNARKLGQDDLIAVLSGAIAQKTWVPGQVCTGTLTVADLAPAPAIAFDDQLPPASALEP